MKRRYYFGSIALIAFLLFLDFSGFGSSSTQPLYATASSPEQRAFLTEEYKTATAEIKTRIDEEHLLFVIKFTFVGAVLGLFSPFFKPKKSGDHVETMMAKPQAIVCLWAAVVVAAVVDVRLMFNTLIIRDLGNWIGGVEHSFLLYHRTLEGWETNFQSSKLFHAPASIIQSIDRKLLTWTLFVVALYSSVIGCQEPKSRPSWNVARAAASVCLLLFALPSLYSGTWFVILGYFAVAAFGIVVLRCWETPARTTVNSDNSSG